MTIGIREEMAEQSLLRKLARLQFSPEERSYCQAKTLTLRSDWQGLREQQLQSLNLRMSALQDRLGHLTDAYIDRMIDQETFTERKNALLLERKDTEEKLAEVNAYSGQVVH